jgi:hypothetical protein
VGVGSKVARTPMRTRAPMEEQTLFPFVSIDSMFAFFLQLVAPFVFWVL